MRDADKPLAEAAPTGPVCPRCGATALPEQQYCGQCGAPLPSEAATSADAVSGTPTAIVEPVATTEPAPLGHEPEDSSKSWWGRQGRKAKIGLVAAGVVVLAAVAAGVVLSQVSPSSDTKLVQTLSTTTDADTRQKATLDLAARHSVEATRDLALTAETDDTARLGLEALRDGYVQELTALREKYVAEVAAEAAGEVLAETEDVLTQTVDCLAVIEDARSLDALGDFIRSGEAQLAAARVHAVQAVAGMDPKLAVPLLKETATLRGHPGRQIAETAEASLGTLPGVTVAASTTTTARVTTTTTVPTTTTRATTTTTTPPTTEMLSKEWGATAEVNGLRITVSKPATKKGVYVIVNGARDETKKVIFAKVVLENLGSTPHVYYAHDFILLDTSDRRHFGDNDDSSGDSVNRPALRSGYLPPGEKLQRYLAYIVPADAVAASIDFGNFGQSGSGFVYVTWE